MEQTATDLRITALNFAIETLRSRDTSFTSVEVLELAKQYEQFITTGK